MTKRQGLSLRNRAINTSENSEDSSLPLKSGKKAVESPDAKPKKVIRDTFSMPEDDYGIIAHLRHECMLLGIAMNKGEILRAGLHALNTMSSQELKESALSVEKIKTGRPKQ